MYKANTANILPIMLAKEHKMQQPSVKTTSTVVKVGCKTVATNLA